MSGSGGSAAESRWDGIYAQADEPGDPADFVVAAAELLPSGAATAADLAGGLGGTALWLAERGLQTTLVEVSNRALTVAGAEADRRGVELELVRHDLEAGQSLDRTWDVVVVSNFLHRPLLAGMVSLLRPGGLALVRIATVTNLERHERPSRRFLVEPGELADLCRGLDVESYAEDWFNDRHEARLIARRPI